MSRTGLILCSTSQATAEQWGRRQPDWVLVSHHHKRIIIVDLCRPSNVHTAQLLAAAMRKQQAYLPLQEALRFYADQKKPAGPQLAEEGACRQLYGSLTLLRQSCLQPTPATLYLLCCQ
jgi:hypothetical protein